MPKNYILEALKGLYPGKTFDAKKEVNVNVNVNEIPNYSQMFGEVEQFKKDEDDAKYFDEIVGTLISGAATDILQLPDEAKTDEVMTQKVFAYIIELMKAKNITTVKDFIDQVRQVAMEIEKKDKQVKEQNVKDEDIEKQDDLTQTKQQQDTVAIKKVITPEEQAQQSPEQNLLALTLEELYPKVKFKAKKIGGWWRTEESKKAREKEIEDLANIVKTGLPIEEQGNYTDLFECVKSEIKKKDNTLTDKDCKYSATCYINEILNKEKKKGKGIKEVLDSAKKKVDENKKDIEKFKEQWYEVFKDVKYPTKEKLSELPNETKQAINKKLKKRMGKLPAEDRKYIYALYGDLQTKLNVDTSKKEDEEYLVLAMDVYLDGIMSDNPSTLQNAIDVVKKEAGIDTQNMEQKVQQQQTVQEKGDNNMDKVALYFKDGKYVEEMNATKYGKLDNEAKKEYEELFVDKDIFEDAKKSDGSVKWRGIKNINDDINAYFKFKGDGDSVKGRAAKKLRNSFMNSLYGELRRSKENEEGLKKATEEFNNETEAKAKAKIGKKIEKIENNIKKSKGKIKDRLFDLHRNLPSSSDIKDYSGNGLQEGSDEYDYKRKYIKNSALKRKIKGKATSYDREDFKLGLKKFGKGFTNFFKKIGKGITKGWNSFTGAISKLGEESRKAKQLESLYDLIGERFFGYGNKKNWSKKVEKAKKFELDGINVKEIIDEISKINEDQKEPGTIADIEKLLEGTKNAGIYKKALGKFIKENSIKLTKGDGVELSVQETAEAISGNSNQQAPADAQQNQETNRAKMSFEEFQALQNENKTQKQKISALETQVKTQAQAMTNMQEQVKRLQEELQKLQNTKGM